jgi:hypothetical protein
VRAWTLPDLFIIGFIDDEINGLLGYFVFLTISVTVTNQLIQWNRILLEKSPVVQLLKKFSKILSIPKVYYCAPKSPALGPFFSQ